MKRHLNREMGKALLTYEELTTLLCQVEAVLNSRPLQPLSSDTNDLEILTPGHFLVGALLNHLQFFFFISSFHLQTSLTSSLIALTVGSLYSTCI